MRTRRTVTPHPSRALVCTAHTTNGTSARRYANPNANKSASDAVSLRATIKRKTHRAVGRDRDVARRVEARLKQRGAVDEAGDGRAAGDGRDAAIARVNLASTADMTVTLSC